MGRHKEEIATALQKRIRGNTLHIDYFGNYPANYEEEFEKWHEKVEDFVRSLEGMREK